VPTGKSYARLYANVYNGTTTSVARFDDAFLSIGFTYNAVLAPPPVLLSVSPNAGPIAGGTNITIAGNNFQNGATVRIGGVAATNVNVVSSTSITAMTPPTSTAGPVSIVVTNPDTQSGTLPALMNPGFESGNAFWKFFSGGSGATGGAFSGSTIAHSGSGYYEIDSAVGNNRMAMVDAAGKDMYLPVAPGQQITFGGWVNKLSGNGSLRYTLALYDANKLNPTYVNTANASVSGSWANLATTTTIPSGVAFVRFWGNLYNPTSASVSRFDDTTLSIGFTYTP
jgi:hypothetical protein